MLFIIVVNQWPIRICSSFCTGGKVSASKPMQPDCARGWCCYSRAQVTLGNKEAEVLYIPRCIKLFILRKIVVIIFHYFFDAVGNECESNIIRYYLVNDEDTKWILLSGESKVFPQRFLSVSRLELTETVLSMKVTCLIKKELESANIIERVCADNKVLLACIRSTTNSFYVFVAIWVQKIQEDCNGITWKTENPVNNAVSWTCVLMAESRILAKIHWNNLCGRS